MSEPNVKGLFNTNTNMTMTHTHPAENCGGVGPLPGSRSETSVAKLPDEHASEAKTALGPSSGTEDVFAEGDNPCEVTPASTTALGLKRFPRVETSRDIVSAETR